MIIARMIISIKFEPFSVLLRTFEFIGLAKHFGQVLACKVGRLETFDSLAGLIEEGKAILLLCELVHGRGKADFALTLANVTDNVFTLFQFDLADFLI